nr:glycosyltransferase [Butyrivibrio sp.]
KRYPGEKEKRVVMVARFHENKNHAMVMEAFKKATDRDYRDYSLVFYGDGPEKKKLLNLAAQLGIDDRVIFRGNVTDVAQHIEKARIFVLASDHEGMPNSLIEAMSLGLACISTDCPCGGPRDLIRDGENGLLVPVRDRDAIASSIRRLIEDDELRERIGSNAVRIRERFAPEVANAKWKEYFDRITG